MKSIKTRSAFSAQGFDQCLWRVLQSKSDKSASDQKGDCRPRTRFQGRAFRISVSSVRWFISSRYILTF